MVMRSHMSPCSRFFFSRRQQGGETLQEFSLALMALMEQFKQSAPDGMRGAEVLLRDQVWKMLLTEPSVESSNKRHELKELLKHRQEQLNQLTETVVSLQNTQSVFWPSRGSPVISRRCQQPGHFAKDCTGGQALHQTRKTSDVVPPCAAGDHHPPSRTL